MSSTPDRRLLAAEIADAARALLIDDGDTVLTADIGVQLAVRLIDGCDAAGISLLHRDTLTTIALTDPLVSEGDQMQYELWEGPCVDAVVEHGHVCSQDLTQESRWPRWAPRVAEELRVRSMLSFRLFTSAQTIGALNLYGFQADAFTDEDHDEGHVLAAQVAVALAQASKLDQLGMAVERRTVIGQAQGILMERFGLDAAQAFGVLNRLSRHRNEKLFSIARTLVDTRQVPDDPTTRRTTDR